MTVGTRMARMVTKRMSSIMFKSIVGLLSSGNWFVVGCERVEHVAHLQTNQIVALGGIRALCPFGQLGEPFLHGGGGDD